METVGRVVVYDEGSDTKRHRRTRLQVASVCCALPQELKQRNVAVRILHGGSCDRTFLIVVHNVHLRPLPVACYILCREGE